MSTGTRVALGGQAIVCCVHDRHKRVVTTEKQLAALAPWAIGSSWPRLPPLVAYDPKQHRIHLCACCQNLFVDPSDEPLYCWACRKPFVHTPAGPLAEPKGPLT
jgi:hypothetical protein